VQYIEGALRTGGVITVGFVIVTAVGTGLVPNSAFDRYVPRSGLDVLFLSSTALLLGVYTTQQCTRVDCSHSPVAYLGGIGGYLSVACPTSGTILKNAADKPDPDFVDGRMRLELSCPDCADPLQLSVDVVSGERVDVRKRVERKAETKTERTPDRF